MSASRLCRSLPDGSPIEVWLQLTAEGRFAEAAGSLRSSTPIAEICARLCPKDHLCEDACILNGPAEPVSIGAIEEFLAEYAIAHGGETAPAPANGRRVAVVGSGPAGLACADELSRRGYVVTIYDGARRAGGLLLEGTSSIRLDEAILERRLDLLKARGVEFRLGIQPGQDITLAGLRAAYDAVFLGPDARQPRPLRMPGGDLPGVIQGVALAGVHAHGEAAGPSEIELKGRRVVVVGEDDTAVECVRTALRCGAGEAVCLCPHAEGALPCCRREYDDAVEEGPGSFSRWRRSRCWPAPMGGSGACGWSGRAPRRRSRMGGRGSSCCPAQGTRWRRTGSCWHWGRMRRLRG
jgi:glutamate synthase (NADPH/NADH) small chain